MRDVLPVAIRVLLGRTSYLMELCLEEHARRYGLTVARFAVLKHLYTRGPTSLTELAALVLRTPSSMVSLIDRMVDAGLVEKERQSEDRRIVLARLTAKGAEMAAELLPIRQAVQAELISILSAEEQLTLGCLLVKLRDHFATVRLNG
jgi:DNA-binding MarR family transcriptional regulator